MDKSKTVLGIGCELIKKYGPTPLHDLPKEEYEPGGMVYDYLSLTGGCDAAELIRKADKNAISKIPCAIMVIEVTKELHQSFLEFAAKCAVEMLKHGMGQQEKPKDGPTMPPPMRS